jgi:hypothetical protein
MSPISTQVSFGPDPSPGEMSEARRIDLHVRRIVEHAAHTSPPGPRLTSDDFLNHMLASVFACPRSPALV